MKDRTPLREALQDVRQLSRIENTMRIAHDRTLARVQYATKTVHRSVNSTACVAALSVRLT
jgi:hypothetical protein